MKKSIFRCVCLSLLIIKVSSCQSPKPGREEFSKKNIEDEVRVTLENYYKDIRKNGLSVELQYLDSSDAFFWVPPGFDSPLNYDTIIAIIMKNASSFKSVENSWDTLAIHPLSEELASYTGRLSSRMTTQDGAISTMQLVETGIVIKRKGKWKLLSGQTSLVNGH